MEYWNTALTVDAMMEGEYYVVEPKPWMSHQESQLMTSCVILRLLKGSWRFFDAYNNDENMLLMTITFTGED